MGLFQSDSQPPAPVPAANAPAANFTAFDVSEVDLAKTALPEVPYPQGVDALSTELAPLMWFGETIPENPT